MDLVNYFICLSDYTLKFISNIDATGPNDWKSTNVWIDSHNRLHLKLAYSPESGWSCAELYTNEHFGFGTYRWFVEGAIDKFDPNVVLGLFNQGAEDATDEIAVEMAKWGRNESEASNLFYTVYPRALNTTKPSSLGLRMVLQGTYTTHQFKWSEDNVSFQSQHGFQNLSMNNVFFTYQTPTTFSQHMPIVSVPLHMNLWAFKGNPPTDGKEVEIIIHDFQYEKELTKESQKFI